MVKSHGSNSRLGVATIAEESVNQKSDVFHKIVNVISKKARGAPGYVKFHVHGIIKKDQRSAAQDAPLVEDRKERDKKARA